MILLLRKLSLLKRLNKQTMKKSIKKSLILASAIVTLSFLFVITSCGKRALAPPIGNNMSFPGSMVALDLSSFLLLNTSANGDYSDGSIQRYSVDSSGNHSFLYAMSVPAHATELAVSSDSKLVALSFDGSHKNTQVQFYNFSNKNSPTQLSNLTISLPSSGGKQAVKKLGFFKRTIVTDNNYYFYGSIITHSNDDGSSGNIPPRVFVAKIASDFSSSQLLFILSYGLNDPNSLAPKTTSRNTAVTSTNAQYTFGYSAPTYVGGSNDLFIAFPTGSVGGFNSTGLNSYPVLPDALKYFGSSNSTCSGSSCIYPDFRVISLAAVDMGAILAGEPLNNSTYFVPLGWNQNGMPYASYSNGTLISFLNNANNADKNSFSYQTGFWASNWAGYLNIGSSAVSSCYTAATAATVDTNQFQILGDNSVFVNKIGLNGGSDNSNSGGKAGNGNETLGLTGFDILRTNINSIKSTRGGINTLGETDFENIANYQIIDRYNSKYNTNLLTTWRTVPNSTSTEKNAGPLTPFMFSRTSNVSNFDSTTSGIANISILNFGSNTCRPYWARNTVATGSLGRDSAWLVANPLSTFTATSLATYPNLTIDPTRPSVFGFPAASGAQICTDVSPVTNSPKVFCVNYLYSTISRYTVSANATVTTNPDSVSVIFTPY